MFLFSTGRDLDISSPSHISRINLVFIILTKTLAGAFLKRPEVILVTKTSTVIKQLTFPSAYVVEIPRHARPAKSYFFWLVAYWVQELIAYKREGNNEESINLRCHFFHVM